MAPPSSTTSRAREVQQMLGLNGQNQGHDDLYFVCIDLEAYEHNQNLITEIGVSVLPARSIRGVDPGENGSAWFDHMQHLHLRPQEYSHLVNKNFIKGCADSFNFGTSVFPKLADCGKILHRIFSEPSKLLVAADLDVPSADTEPKIVLVGHDLSNDTKYLGKLGFSPTNITARLDTQSLARQSKVMSPGLRRLLDALGIEATNLHNAGNDAAYTLQALVSIAVREHVAPGSVGVAVEEEFRSVKPGQKSRKPKTFKEARQLASLSASVTQPKPSSHVPSTRQTEPAPHADHPPTRTMNSLVPSLVRRVGSGGSALVQGSASAQADQSAMSRRGMATAMTAGQRTKSRRAKKKRLRSERAQG